MTGLKTMCIGARSTRLHGHVAAGFCPADQRLSGLAGLAMGVLLAITIPTGPSQAQSYEPLPPVSGGGGAQSAADDAYRPVEQGNTERGYGSGSVYNRGSQPYDPDAGIPGRSGDRRPGYQPETRYDREPIYEPGYEPRRRNGDAPDETYGAPYGSPDGRPSDGGDYYRKLPPRDGGEYAGEDDGTYSQGEIVRAGHGFFGSVSKGLASAVEYAFKNAGRPNGYILGEDAGGAFVAGLRYGEGRLHTRRFGTQKVYWQGPTLGYDFGAEGSKTMVLIYNLDHPSQIYERFGGVQGSAYLVGGVSIQFQKRGDVTLAPIRSGVGLRLGANVGYLKYTRSPTWNPF
ncbi:MAG: EipA family protein [Pseudomonadota bacterium]